MGPAVRDPTQRWPVGTPVISLCPSPTESNSSDIFCICSRKHACESSIFPASFSQSLKSLMVIDVTEMCIVDAPTPCRYVTLSYCWGTVPVLKHLRQNSRQLRTIGALSSLPVPATIKDAMEVVKGIEERYLWVDALCIIQDDPVSQKAQLAQMGLVYALAAFTIVGGSGGNAESGLPGVGASSRHISQQVLTLESKTLLEVVTGDDYYSGLNSSDWITRAWTLQEKLLSKKLLIFTQQQVYWSCWNATWLEEIVLEDVYSVDFQHQPLNVGPERGSFSELGDDEEKSNSIQFSDRQPVNCSDLYRQFVNAYQERKLSYKADILNAFSGLCQALSAVDGEQYHWGLPTSRFNESLCWWIRGGGSPNHASYLHDGPQLSPVRFPSWSWAAWHGSLGHPWISWLSDSAEESRPRNIPVTIYVCDTNGRMQRITEAHVNSNVNLSESTYAEDELTTHPREVQDIDDPGLVNTGHLYFWSTTAELYVRQNEFVESQYGWSSQHLYSILAFKPEDYSLLLDSSSTVLFQESDVMADLPEGRPHTIGDMERYNVAVLDFVVISWLKPSSVTCLIVQWNHGIAYRIGLAYFDRKAWGNIKTRQWKKVVLG